MTNTSSQGCGSEWYGDCLPYDVWGATDVLAIGTPTSVPVLTVGASSTATSQISVGGGTISNAYVDLEFLVRGRAMSSSSRVSMQTRFFTSAGAVLASHEDLLHAGTAGVFSVNFVKQNIPAGAASWQARLQVENDTATFNLVAADCFGGCNPPPSDEHPECEHCWKDCGDYCAEGVDCGGGGCSAECNEDLDEADLACESGSTYCV